MDFRWRCPVCGYVHEGPTEPEFATCPVCGTPADQFVRENYPEEHFGNWTHQERKQVEEMARTGTYPIHAKGSTRRFFHFDNLMILPSFIAQPPLLDEEATGVTSSSAAHAMTTQAAATAFRSPIRRRVPTGTLRRKADQPSGSRLGGKPRTAINLSPPPNVENKKSPAV